MTPALPRPIATAFRFPSSLANTRTTSRSPLCRRCWTNELSRQPNKNAPFQRGFYSTSSQQLEAPQLKNASGSAGSKRSSRRRTAIRLAAGGGTVGVAVIGFWDDIKHGYAAAERSARVATTLAICINEYVASIVFTSLIDADLCMIATERPSTKKAAPPKNKKQC
jgi:aarF domain-containing kinase